ncbi:MAG: choice-of-anchor D domain-containing protein [Terracidiphilus sp.]
MYGILVHFPSDSEFSTYTASPYKDCSRPKQRRAHSRAQICRLNHWSTALLIMLSCCLLLAVAGCGMHLANGGDTGTLVASPDTITFGAVSIGQTASTTVSLLNGSLAPVEITQLSLTGQSFSVVGPSSLPVTIAAGGTYNLSVQFDPTVTGAATGQLTITSNSSTNATAVIGLSGTGTAAPAGTAALSALSCSNSSMTGSGTDACTVTLNVAAASSGLVVSLASSSTAVTVPATVTVPANATSATFTATVSSVATAQAVTLTASAGSVSETFALQLNAVVPTLSVSATSVAFGSVAVNTAATQSVTLTSTGTTAVTVNSATLTGTDFTVSGATFPATLTPGQAATLSVQFDPTAAGAATGRLTIISNSSTNGTAVIGLSGTGTVAPAALRALSCGSGTMTGSGTDACTVTLSAIAPSGGLSVSVSSSNAAVTVPATVRVPANATSATFTATVSSVAVAQTATLTASAAGVSETFALQLNAAVPTLSINTTSVGFGNVVVNTPATQSLTLTSTGTAAVTVNSAVLTGTGFTFSGPNFPVTLTPGQTVTLGVQFDPTAAGAATGQLTITSNSSTNGTAVIALTGTGTAASYAVDLSWDAPSSSTDPVVGYNVYRSPSGSSTYQLLNSSVDTQTTYVDSRVQSGLSYDYIVESVDASGNESVPTSPIVVTIP